MALFRIRWLRRFVRKHTKPMSLDTAARNKQRLSLLYMFFAWNAVGFVTYSIFTKGKSNWAVFHNLEEDTESPGGSLLCPSMAFINSIPFQLKATLNC